MSWWNCLKGSPGEEVYLDANIVIDYPNASSKDCATVVNCIRMTLLLK